MSEETPNPEEATVDLLSTLMGWLEDEPGVSTGDGGVVTVAGEPPLVCTLTTDDERITLAHERTEPGAGAARADAIIAAVPERGTSLRVSAQVDRAGVAIRLTNHVFVDGLNRQSFVAAFNELVSATDAVAAGAGDIPQPVDTEAATRIQEPVQETIEPVVEQQPVTAVFAPTHSVPKEGMRAWAEPDPSQQPITRLEARVELMQTERRGDWSRVVGSNGWTGWVDARRLQPYGGAAAAAPAGVSFGGVEIRPLPLVAAAALIVSAFLPWVSISSANALDVPVSFLWDYTSSGDPQLGWVLIALGVAALALGVTRQPLTPVAFLVGILAVAVSLVFVIQMARGVSAIGSGANLFDWLGFAPWVALGAGVILVAGAATSTK